ncbi:MAG: PIN domain-containing protein [Chloroflexi bacterium CG07_land_8_20_14_0_80_51_10]|nr:MAG: PIN domain-containing protein [Chloroflexi bacterium CG07_land_8_20_14_0_80_51_10]
MIIIYMDCPSEERKLPSEVCFVDTVCCVALLNKTERIHQEVNSEYKRLLKNGYHLITTTAVLSETANSLCAPRFRAVVSRFYRRVQASQYIEVVFVDERLWEAGWQLYEQRNDKEWSLTDCISFVVMQERNISEALTTDRHFEQAGFIRLLHIPEFAS